MSALIALILVILALLIGALYTMRRYRIGERTDETDSEWLDRQM